MEEDKDEKMVKISGRRYKRNERKGRTMVVRIWR